MSLSHPIEALLRPRSFIHSSNSEALVLQSTTSETRITFVNSSTNATAAQPRYVVGSSNDSLRVLRDDSTLVTMGRRAMDGMPLLTVHGASMACNVQISTPNTKAIILQDYNELSTNQFAGMGFSGGLLNYQLPARNGRHVFQAAAMDGANAEWMRIQEGVLGLPQVGIGTTLLPANQSLVVAGNTLIQGTLRVSGTLDVGDSPYVQLDPATQRIASNQLPESVPVLRSSDNKLDESILPQSFAFQFLRSQKNIGIGTRAPAQKLHVWGSLAVNERIGVGTKQPTARVHAVEHAANVPTMVVDNTAGGDPLRVSLGGAPALYVLGTHAAVGVGTSVVSPSACLEVGGNVAIHGQVSCSNVSGSKVSATDVDVTTADGKLVFRQELLESEGLYEPFVRAGSPFIFERGLATNTVTSTQSQGTVLFRNTGIRVDGETFLRTPPLVFSDARRKHDVALIGNAFDRIDGVRGYTYHLGDGKRMAGVLAQEVMQVLPEAVASAGDAHFAVRYESVMALMLESLHDIKHRLAALEKRA